MAAANLSRFFQSSLNAAIFAWYPPRISRLYMRLLGQAYFRRKPEEKQCCLRALKLVLGAAKGGRGCDPDLEKRVLRGIFDHYFEKMLTAYWGFGKMRNFLLRQVQLSHADLLDYSLAEGRGVILSTAHFGAVEFLPAALSFRGYPVTMVVRFQTPRLKRTLEGLARRANLELLDMEDGGVIASACRCLREGRIFITELDEMKLWKPTACKMMNFFGQRVPLDRGVELLSRRTGAPILLGLMERLGGLRYQLVFEQPQEHLAAPTRLGPDAQLLKRLEHYIYDAPDHWYIWNELHHLEQFQAA